MGRKMSSTTVCLKQNSFKTQLGFYIHDTYMKQRLKKKKKEICPRGMMTRFVVLGFQLLLTWDNEL